MGLIAGNLILRFWRFWEPAHIYWDERAYYLPAVREILEKGIDPNFQHPPLAKLLVSTSVGFFGDNSLGWRFWPIILSTIGVVATYFLAKRLFKSRKVAVVASILLSFEFSWFVIGRVAIPEMFLGVFLLVSVLFFHNALETKKKWWFLISAVFFGLAVASKWTGLLFVPIFLFLLLNKYQQKTKAVKIFTGFALAGALIYLGSYFIFLQNHSLGELFNRQFAMLNFHITEINERIGGERKHQFLTVFWPIDLYPLIMNSTFEKVRATIFMFNPALIFPSLVISFLAVLKWFRGERSVEKILLVYCFLIFWVAFLISPRVTYPYWWLPGMPFAAILFAGYLAQRSKKDPFLVVGYLVLVGLLFAFYYPILSYSPVKTWYLQILTGFSGN